MVTRIRLWWRQWQCHRRGHDFTDWTLVAPGFPVWKEERTCQRCTARDYQIRESVYVAFDDRPGKTVVLTGWLGKPPGDGLRVPVLMQPLQAVWGVPSGEPPAFGQRLYQRTTERDPDGRAIFR